MRAILPTIAAVLCFAAPAEALTIDPGRITREDARYAARSGFATFAGMTGQRLSIAPCRPLGRKARVCRVRVGDVRWRVVAFYANAEREVTASARRLP
jgi:hypothetical protein